MPSEIDLPAGERMLVQCSLFHFKAGGWAAEVTVVHSAWSLTELILQLVLARTARIWPAPWGAAHLIQKPRGHPGQTKGSAMAKHTQHMLMGLRVQLPAWSSPIQAGPPVHTLAAWAARCSPASLAAEHHQHHRAHPFVNGRGSKAEAYSWLNGIVNGIATVCTVVLASLIVRK